MPSIYLLVVLFIPAAFVVIVLIGGGVAFSAWAGKWFTVSLSGGFGG